MAWRHLRDELEWNDVGGRLLANIARGIYSHADVVREYVQNACDSYKGLPIMPDNPEIIVTPEGKNLAIQDFGTGMDEDEIRTVKKIAVSTKTEIEEMIGFRGIGIWAGFQACERLIILTKKKGVSSRYRLVIDFKDILNHV
ncbi:MAG: ATP-binding protein, partial [Bacteroidetes bacterium]|nr:ATP-binding protein [Bacteroidota bacterium]